MKRKKQKEHEEQDDQRSLSHEANFGSDYSLPEDYFMSGNFSSRYGSTIIDTIIPEEQQLIQDKENEEHENGNEPPPQYNQKQQTLED